MTDVASPTGDRRPRMFTLQRVIVWLVLLASGVALYFGFALHEGSSKAVMRPAAIRALSPEPGTFDVRQTTVFYELDPRYTGTLRIDSITIPDDQLNVIEGLNRVSFTPGEGMEIEELAPGRHSATAVFWPVSEGRDAATSYTWRFNVH